jgi:hypothetical protein
MQFHQLRARAGARGGDGDVDLPARDGRRVRQTPSRDPQALLSCRREARISRLPQIEPGTVVACPQSVKKCASTLARLVGVAVTTMFACWFFCSRRWRRVKPKVDDKERCRIAPSTAPKWKSTLNSLASTSSIGSFVIALATFLIMLREQPHRAPSAVHPDSSASVTEAANKKRAIHSDHASADAAPASQPSTHEVWKRRYSGCVSGLASAQETAAVLKWVGWGNYATIEASREFVQCTDGAYIDTRV